MYTKNDIKLAAKDYLKKHKSIINILKNLNIASKERNFLYWLDFSSLLAIKRNDLFSEYSDTDIGVISNNNMEKIFSFLIEVKEKLDIKINVSYFNEKSNMTKPGEISKLPFLIMLILKKKSLYA